MAFKKKVSVEGRAETISRQRRCAGLKYKHFTFDIHNSHQPRMHVMDESLICFIPASGV